MIEEVTEEEKDVQANRTQGGGRRGNWFLDYPRRRLVGGCDFIGGWRGAGCGFLQK